MSESKRNMYARTMQKQHDKSVFAFLNAVAKESLKYRIGLAFKIIFKKEW